MSDRIMKLRTSPEGACKGDVISMPDGRKGICLTDKGDICWRMASESDDWWLHRAQCQLIMLDDIANRASDGSVHPGGRTKP